MALDVGANPMSVDAIAAHLEQVYAGQLGRVAVQSADTVVAHCAEQSLRDTAEHLKNDALTGYGTLTLITAVDLGAQLESVYHLYSWKTNTYLCLHVAVARDAAEIDTVCDIWPAADWLEREAWDMMGIRYRRHPDLRRILLRDDFVGHPLRKDYVDTAENHPHV
ncbi:MAG: NADH-quinone oxidoreductase subunit C [Thermoleophilia bacterium]